MEETVPAYVDAALKKSGIGVSVPQKVARKNEVGADVPNATGAEAKLKTGTLVCIDGLKMDPSLNGLAAKVFSYDINTCRCRVALERGLGTKRLERCNIATEAKWDSVDGEGCDSVSGTGCHDEINIGRIPTASGLSLSSCAAPACP